MTARILLLLGAFVVTAKAAEPPPLVLDATDVSFLHEALDRLHRPYEPLPALTAALKPDRILVLAGKDLAPGEGAARAVQKLLQDGGRVLALGGGARWMLKEKLFDATAYYPTGTTIHQSGFDGYHRLTFGYPGAKLNHDWTYGVAMLLRATGGPLMTPGAHAISVLRAGGPFSLAAFQRYGSRGGLALLIGPDPQGGNQYLSLDKPTPTRGDTLGTDALLDNALAWLGDPKCNLIPNGGFEENAALPAVQSHWEITERLGGTHEFAHGEAPEGTAFLRLTGRQPKSEVHAKLYLPVVVEPGAKYRLSFRYRASGGATLKTRHLASADSGAQAGESKAVELPLAPAWQVHEEVLEVPKTHHLLEIEVMVKGTSSLEVDDVRLCLIAIAAE